MKTRTAGVLLFCAVMLTASMARADSEYEDEDSDYLKVTSFFVEPIGRVLEWVVFRPIHSVHHFIDPTGRIDGTPNRRCYGLRPRRECGLDH